MKQLQLTVCVALAMLLLGSEARNALALDRDAEKVRKLLKQMTLEEKVGQMVQVSFGVLSNETDVDKQYLVDQAKLERAILTYHVGSVLHGGGVAYSEEQWHELITRIQDVATYKSRLRIPVLCGIDAIHGATFTKGATLFPQAISMASSWNVDLARQEGEITALEVRATGFPWNFYPVLDVGRQPLWPRFWETFGEDPHLAAEFGKSYIAGLQGSDYGAPDKVASCMKHFVGYGFPFSGFDRTPSYMAERTLREFFLPPFEAAIKAGSPTVMVNSSEIDGIPGHANFHLLTEVLKGELQFKGFVISDFADIKRLYTRDRVAASPKEAVALAVNAGVDMSMVPDDFSFNELLVQCVQEGLVSTARIDDAVTRILTVKARMGLFEKGRAYPDPALKGMLGTREHTEANLAAARESIILLKNAGNLLPLAKTSKVFITGPTSTLLSSLNGGWTITWQGDAEQRYPSDKLTVLAAIREKIGSNQVTSLPGATFNELLDIGAAVEAAKSADATIVCLGEKAYCETPGNIGDLTLDPAQIALTQALIKTGKPVIVVLLEGRPRVIAPIVEGSTAIVLGFLPGMEGGRALADVLFGDVNPSGKLPCSYPKSANGFVTYDHKPLEEKEQNVYAPQFPFGFGLSYTSFGYSDLRLGHEVIGHGEEQTVSVTVRNTGKVAGKEVVQLYLQDEYGSVSRPVRQLKGFCKIALAPNEEREVSFTLTPEDLSFIGLNNTRIVEPGAFKVMIDRLEKEFVLK
jgi:beta-glucosidase